MKKAFFASFAVIVLLFGSCASAPVKMALDSFEGDWNLAELQLSEFSILGRVEGRGHVIYNTSSGAVIGDTHKYGFIDQDVDTALGSIVKLSRFKKGYLTYDNPVELARANADAQLIEQAKAMGADRIIYITYSVIREAGKGLKLETVTVEARGVAIKLLAEIPEPVAEEPIAPEPVIEVFTEPEPVLPLEITAVLEGEVTQEKVNEALTQVYNTHRSGLDLSGAETYLVQRGDTLSGIIRITYGDLTGVGDAGVQNGFYFPFIMMASEQDIVDPDLIEPGMELVLPDLRKNLDNPGARQAIKDTLVQAAYIYSRKGDVVTENGLKTLAGSL